MFWMMLLMFLPLPALALFYLLPLSTAIPFFILLLAISGSYHCLMMQSMRFPLETGPETMAGSVAFIRHWERDSGQVLRNGEIWQAKSSDGQVLLSDQDKVIIDRRTGLTLLVRTLASPTSGPLP